MEHQYLSAANTYTSLGPTYYATFHDHFWSRENTMIDFRLHSAVWTRVRLCKVHLFRVLALLAAVDVLDVTR